MFRNRPGSRLNVTRPLQSPADQFLDEAPVLAHGTGQASVTWKNPCRDLESRWSIHQLTSLRTELAQELPLLRCSGVQAIGLNWRKLNEAGLISSVRRLRHSGLRASSLGWAGGFTGANDCSFEESLTNARRMLRVCAQLNCPNLMVVTGPAGNHIRSHRQRLAAKALEELLPLASVYRVNLCLQPMHRTLASGWTFLHSLDETLQLLDQVRHPRVMLGFGSWHLREEPRLLDRVLEAVPRTGVVSLADWDSASRGAHDRLLPGDGELPIAEIVDAFETAGYRGWYETEVWSRDLWKLDAGDLMRRCVQSRDQIASRMTVRQ